MQYFFKLFHLNNLTAFAVFWTITISKALNTWLWRSLTCLYRWAAAEVNFSHLNDEYWKNNWDAHKLWAGSSNLTIYCNSDSYILKAITLQNSKSDLFGMTNQVTSIFLPEVCKSTLQPREVQNKQFFKGLMRLKRAYS